VSVDLSRDMIRETTLVDGARLQRTQHKLVARGSVCIWQEEDQLIRDI
jgi:hypothetical protein